MATQRDIKYINKDFTSFKQALVDYAKNYFPDIYNDFSEASPGNMFIEMASYVGDVLSFYIDKQTQEDLLLYAQEKENLISMAYALGYRPKVTSTAIVDLDVYQQLPATIIGGIAYPDYNYCLSIGNEAKVKSSYGTSNVIFITQNLIDFSFSSSADPTTISIYQVNQTTNQPDYYLLKKSVKAVAGTIKSIDFNFGSPIKFNSVTLPDPNVIQILDVVDGDGNKWYEVPYLAQSTIFVDVKNNELNDPFLSQYSDTTPYLLKLEKVSRRFVTRFDQNDMMYLEFGSGITSEPDEEIIPNSDNVGLGTIYSLSKFDKAYDPSNFLYTQDYGLAPSNTTLTVRYLIGGGAETNSPSNTVSQIYEISANPISLNQNALNQNLLNYIKNSVGFNNPNPASGGGSGDSIEDIRLKTIANFPTQLRNVTKDDYMIRTLSMPSKYGTIAKAYVTQDMSFETQDKVQDFVSNNPLLLSLYVLSYDSDKKLTNASYAIKENLRNYISQYKITTDAVDIKDAYYINIGINFDIVVRPSFNSREVLTQCIDALKSYFDIDKWQINQPIIISDLYNQLSCDIKGLQSIVKIEVVNKYGVDKGYSPYGYDIQGATKNNVIYPSLDPSIFEVRFPESDIYGRIVNY
jgi:hypothetical protein